MPTINPVHHLIAHLTDAFESDADDLPSGFDGAPGARAIGATLTQCVPLLAIMREFLDRGPAALTIDAVERYRDQALYLVEQIIPVIERETDLTMAAFADHLAGESVVELRRAA